MMAKQKKLRIAIAGLGRMGQRHALNYAKISRAEVVAVFSPDPKEIAWAEEALADATPYTDYDEMINHPGLQAVCIATISSAHAPQAIKAIEKGLHVMCEKPLSTSVEVSRTVVEAAAKQPHLKVLCGFSRRFDSSYREAYARVASGTLGTPVTFRSQTCDKTHPPDFLYTYSRTSGGLFVDCGIHDADLCYWFLGAVKPKSIAAYGITAIEPRLKEFRDVDNAFAIVEFWGGKIAYFGASRMMVAGQHDETEIVGEKGKVTVNVNPKQNLVELHGPAGITREIPQTYWDRFKEAFEQEAREFTDCILNDTPLPFELAGAMRALELASALQESVQTGKMIKFNEDGERIEVSGSA